MERKRESDELKKGSDRSVRLRSGQRLQRTNPKEKHNKNELIIQYAEIVLSIYAMKTELIHEARWRSTKMRMLASCRKRSRTFNLNDNKPVLTNLY